MLELVIGIGLVAVVVGALAIVTTNSLMSAQFSKNQVLATKKAQENLEKVRTIKKSGYGVCTISDPISSCSAWEDIWTANFGTVAANCVTNNTGCTFILVNNCYLYNGEQKPFCLRYSATKADLGNGFTGQIIIEDETFNQKRVTSRVYWTDSSGEHSSYLVTVLTRI